MEAIAMVAAIQIFVVKPHPNTNAMITYLMLLCFFSVILYVFLTNQLFYGGILTQQQMLFIWTNIYNSTCVRSEGIFPL